MNILELISEDCIKIPLESKRKNDLLHEMIDILMDAGKLTDSSSIFQALRNREDQCSTGLGEGIAIPHAKSEDVSELIMAIGIAPKGVDFEALDGEDTKVFFMIIAPSDQAGLHIEALSEVARLTRSEGFMQSLLDSENAAEVLQVLQK